MTDLSPHPEMHSLISAAVAATLTPEFVEKEVGERVRKLITEAIDSSLRSYSGTGEMVKAAVQEALKVERLDLPSYGSLVTDMLKAQISQVVAPIVAGRLAEDMEELLGLAPKEVKLSKIAEEMLERYDSGDRWGKVITVLVDEGSYNSTWIYLDEENHYEHRERYSCKYRMLVNTDDGRIHCVYVGGRDSSKGSYIGMAFGLEQKLRAWVACGTKLIVDQDAVITSIGDY